MASKKRASRKGGSGKSGTAGLSGNPQRRAVQLQERASQDREHEHRHVPSFQAPGTQYGPPDWWQESHESVLARVRGTEWPSDRLDAETLAGEIVGDELHARMNMPVRIGLQPSRWLDALAGAAEDALIMDIATDGGDWPRLWAFLCGLDEETRLEFAATQLAKRGLTADVPPGYQPTGEFLLARDAYGTRFLLAASFFIPNGPAPTPTPHHWYAWDLDWCSMGAVMAAGPCPSPAEALAEWRTAVGPAARACDLSSCPPDLAMRLLHPALALGTIWEMVHGGEPRELMGEYFRLSHRACLLAEYLADNFAETIEDEPPGEAEEEELAAPYIMESFLNWHAERTPNASVKSRNLTALALEPLIDAWTPFMSPDKAMFCACSPHRIEETGIVLRDDYDPDDANDALELLPEWVQWCAERSGLDSESTARSLAAARAQAAIVVDENYAPAPDRDPFARQE